MSSDLLKMNNCELLKYLNNNVDKWTKNDLSELLGELIKNNSFVKIILCFTFFKDVVSMKHIMDSLENGYLDIFSKLIDSPQIKMNDEIIIKTINKGLLFFLTVLHTIKDKKYCFDGIIRKLIDDSNDYFFNILISEEIEISEKHVLYAVDLKRINILKSIFEKSLFLTKNVYESLLRNNIVEIFFNHLLFHRFLNKSSDSLKRFCVASSRNVRL